ncbi:MAG: hypothetical protein H6883_11520 [Rhodobiaceae bacterium]|nr:hypothetical protein [Rhodobiaceae bacterium]
MTEGVQKRLAIAAALALLVLFVAANVHLIAVALRSQSACTTVEHVPPAKRIC